MAVTVSAIDYYKGTGPGDGPEWAGWDKNGRRVIRYTLDVTGDGATSITLTHKYHTYTDANGTYKSPDLCASLSTDSEAYINANGEINGYQVKVVKDQSASTYTVALDDLTLCPGQLYYVWIYPMTDDFAFAYLYNDVNEWTITSDGSVGVIYIETEDGLGVYLCYIYDGSEWELYILYIYNGTDWEICS